MQADYVTIIFSDGKNLRMSQTTIMADEEPPCFEFSFDFLQVEKSIKVDESPDELVTEKKNGLLILRNRQKSAVGGNPSESYQECDKLGC